MLNLKEAATLARERERNRIRQAFQGKSAPRRSVAVAQQQRAFQSQLLDFLRRSKDEKQGPIEAPDALFLALPERLLSKWFALAYGERRSEPHTEKHTESVPSEAWKRWDKLGAATRLANIPRTIPRAVLVAHGLSPLPDSILLLADLGRASRVAAAYGVGIHALLADISWMSYNRSIRRFDLSEEEIETGLRICMDRRQRLYEALGIKYEVHSISPFAQKGAIHEKKLELIAGHYRELIATLWGPEILELERPLEPQELARLGRPLPQSLSEASPLEPLARFPGALLALERALGSHLSVVRAVANRFKVVTADTFTYYFAQYYAQQGYRGSHLKVAPISERDFDEPFDELDESFRLWGEGHDPIVVAPAKKRPRPARLSAVYLPQYRIGKWQVLPYTPMSLDAMRHANMESGIIRENLLLLSDNDVSAVHKATKLLSTTLEIESAQVNRVVADVLSLMAYFAGRRGPEQLESACARLGAGTAEELLARIDPALALAYSVESERDAEWSVLWSSWLGAAESSVEPEYIPSHIRLACFEEVDWSADRLTAAATLLVAAIMVADRVCA